MNPDFRFPSRRPTDPRGADKDPELRTETLLSELGRQKERLETDFISRELGIVLACAIFSVRLPIPLILSIYVFIVLTEYVDVLLYRILARGFSLTAYVAILLNSLVAFFAFSSLGTLIWFSGDPLAQVAGVLSLVGALINVTTARSMHMPLGIVCALSPALALLYISASGWGGPAGFGSSAMALVATIGLLGYFGSALYQNFLVQRRLADALDRARHASEAKSRFLSEMSHEMRTPLNGILGLAQALRSADRPSAQTAAAIEEGARDLGRLVDDVLDLAGAEEGRIFPRPVRVHLGAEAATLQRALNAGQNVVTVTDLRLDPDLPELAAFDAMLLRKCLVRVVSRSGIASDPPLPATLALDRPGPGVLRLLVLPVRPLPQADGPGGQTRSRLALSDELTDRLLESLQGRVRQSAAGGDSPGALSLELPVTWLPPLPRPEAVAALRPLSALVVDDVATNRLVLGHILGQLGIRAAEVSGGTEALAALGSAGGKSTPFDLVLLDMNMPGMDGQDTFRAIRAGSASLPVIALTADATGDRREHYAGLGLDGFVSKPVDKSVLWAEIVTALRLGG